MKKFAIGLILDHDKDTDIKDNAIIKILGFDILNLPDFTEEILLFKDMQNLDETLINDLGIDMFHKAKEAYLIIEYNELKNIILNYDETGIQKIIDVPITIGVCKDIQKIIDIPMNIGVCKDIDNNILFGIESYDLDKTHDKIITKSKYQKIRIYDEDTDICSDDLTYNFVSNHGGFIINNNIKNILYNTIKSKPVMTNITNGRYAESVIYLNTVIRDLYDINVTDEFIIMNNSCILRTKFDLNRYDTLIIPETCENFFVTYLYGLARYNKIYFPKNIKRIRFEISDCNKHTVKNTTLCFKKETLKGVCINELFNNNIAKYYRDYVNKLKDADKEIPDDFNEFVYLKDAIKLLKHLPIKIEFV